ncbi:UDP-N-acetylmuramoylalanyl-D-glutamate--2,6-diaminopimelate ligase [Albimonas donghaensis]|uniref:UDP-N-acetylmuramoyl-L-alanyl-D-glutamate--2,6-diaminopimelate ligase n=1 Tax=Albimonas donghaensis TaxID=356660 RepID=A0A1H3EKP2_9RHOB|nr:UDP-N-acetylmuramoyl-L-alanyl-D-glutamate--2,6-diaminopimelate ligase [Albimonas donghaensis]SDX79150.1 UDP-N-acetylmuramoylalanyl-D-glutamate--2,6-diaminopimelate ligase [Albimonas donghaensis]
MSGAGITLAGLGLPAADLAAAGLAPDAPVAGLTADSRQVKPGWVFFALKGVMDGAEFAPFALRQQALAVVCSAPGAETVRRLWDRPAPPAEALPLVVVPEPRLALARAAAAFFDAQPAVMAAVTGTNGKTSVASFLRQVWEGLGRRAAAFGTVGVEGAVERAGGLTTPDPMALHALLAELAGAGVTHAAMEASSHGLAQFRADGVRLTAAGLTNITRDHMDYHRDHADYVAAKLALFGRVLPEGGTAALNADDPVFAQAAALARSRGQRVIAVGRGEHADLRLTGAAYHETGQDLDFTWRGRSRRASIHAVGGFQGENALMAAALAIGCGEDADAVFATLPSLRAVKGRMEHVATRANGARIYVDYSHTAASLETAIAALRLHTPGRLIVAFGAGGDRDPGKRPLMGEAARAADIAIVTDDNPRSEPPEAIRAAIIAGMAGADSAPDSAPVEIGDRGEAILAGVDMLGSSDRLLIAGKGHETGQTVAGITHPFDDAEQARAAVAALDGLAESDGQEGTAP